MQRTLHASQFEKEIQLATSRSSGPGGQNVNKVNSRVTLRFEITASQILTSAEKEILTTKLAPYLTKGEVLILSAQEKRSQLQNKELVLQKFERLINRALVRKKIRKASKPTKGAIEKRILEKKRHSEKKQWRMKF